MEKKKPKVICHMASTINGKIIVDNWGNDSKAYSKLYQQCHESFDSEAWMCGRVTMEKDFTGGHQPSLQKAVAPIKREVFIGDKEAKSFAVAVDATGKLGWEENEISGDHIIEVLTEEVSDTYLHFLREKSISYIFAGTSAINMKEALHQLATHFPIKTIMLEGGGHINDSLLSDSLIDEVSVLILPIADATPGTPTTFEIGKQPATSTTGKLQLEEVKQLGHDVLWLKYTVAHTNA
jgi:riboflavin biosynthesis pyrimidine reductase